MNDLGLNIDIKQTITLDMFATLKAGMAGHNYISQRAAYALCTDSSESPKKYALLCTDPPESPDIEPEEPIINQPGLTFFILDSRRILPPAPKVLGSDSKNTSRIQLLRYFGW